MKKGGWRISRTYRALGAPVLIFLLAFFILPMILVVARAVLDPAPGIGNFIQIFNSRAQMAVLANTFRIAFVVAIMTLLIGYPFAYVMARSRGFWLNLLLAGLMISLWTSVIVRTYAWISLLQRRGIVNEALISLGWIEKPIRFIGSSTGVYIGMIHVLLPLMVLPLLNTMTNIDQTKIRAGEILGGNPLQVFLRVYLPMSLPGVFAGFLLVFISASGFFVTPSMLGGYNDGMIAILIDEHIRRELNWPVGSALAVILLFVSVVLFAVYERVTRRFGGGQV